MIAISSMLDNMSVVSDLKLNWHASSGWDFSAELRKNLTLRCVDALMNLPPAVMSQSHEHQKQGCRVRGFRLLTIINYPGMTTRMSPQPSPQTRIYHSEPAHGTHFTLWLLFSGNPRASLCTMRGKTTQLCFCRENLGLY